MEPVGNVCHEGSLIRLGDIAHILDIEQVRDANLFGGNVEGELHVSAVVVLVEAVVIDEVGAVNVEQSATVCVSCLGVVASIVCTYKAKPSFQLVEKSRTSTSS